MIWITPARYERDIEKVTSILIILKTCDNNGTEEIGLVTPPQGELLGLLNTGTC